ncbi:hypothetical protein TURU_133465 [Turdus rufiventris]|nr:hypothetical protein TURU_133465 [Turdus rufiventris]
MECVCCKPRWARTAFVSGWVRFSSSGGSLSPALAASCGAGGVGGIPGDQKQVKQGGKHWLGYSLLELEDSRCCYPTPDITMLGAVSSVIGPCTAAFSLQPAISKHPVGAPGLTLSGFFKEPEGHQWAFGIAAVETEGNRQLKTLPGLSDNPSVVGFLRFEEQQKSAGLSLLSPGEVCSTPGINCPRGGNSPTICHGLIQTALEKGEAPEDLQYIDYIIVWGNTAEEVFEKGETIQILLKVGFAIKQARIGNLNRPGILEVITNWPKGEFWIIITRGRRAGDMLRLLHHITSYQKVRDYTLSSLMDPAILKEPVGNGEQLYGVLCVESQKLLRVKVD